MAISETILDSCSSLIFRPNWDAFDLEKHYWNDRQRTRKYKPPILERRYRKLSVIYETDYSSKFCMRKWLFTDISYTITSWQWISEDRVVVTLWKVLRPVLARGRW